MYKIVNINLDFIFSIKKYTKLQNNSVYNNLQETNFKLIVYIIRQLNTVSLTMLKNIKVHKKLKYFFSVVSFL